MRRRIAFLLALGLTLTADASFGEEDADASVALLEQRGRALFDTHGCATCHTRSETAAETGVVVPLEGLALRYTPSLLAELLDAPPPEMPRVALTVEERRAIAAYLLQAER